MKYQDVLNRIWDRMKKMQAFTKGNPCLALNLEIIPILINVIKRPENERLMCDL